MDTLFWVPFGLEYRTVDPVVAGFGPCRENRPHELLGHRIGHSILGVGVGAATGFARSRPPTISPPNEAYFVRCDRMIELAAKYGLLVTLDSCETIDHLNLMLKEGATKCRAYGQYLGNRYKSLWSRSMAVIPRRFDTGSLPPLRLGSGSDLEDGFGGGGAEAARLVLDLFALRRLNPAAADTSDNRLW